jgi:hypothetical protein
MSEQNGRVDIQDTNPNPPFLVWYEKNVRWIGPILLVIFCATIAGIGATFIGIVYGAIKKTDIYKLSLEKIESDKRVQDLLGTPLKDGWMVRGLVDLEGPNGQVDLGFEIYGSHDKGWAQVKANKKDGVWTFEKIELKNITHHKEPVILLP